MSFKRISIITLILFSLFTSFDIHAQRRKKNPGNEKETSIKKDSYEIAILLPYDQQTKATNSSAILFYEGIKLALNDLEHEGIKLKIKTHVMDQTKPLSFENFAYIRELKYADLIIAPVSGPIIKDIAHYAEDNKINFVSTLSPYNAEGEANNYFHILQPTLQTNVTSIVHYTKAQFPKNNKIILYNNSDIQNYQYIKEALKNDKHIINFDLDVVKLSASNIEKQLKKNEPNVIYIASISPKQTENILQTIQSINSEYQLEVVGMPTLGSVSSIKNKGHEHINYYFTTAFHFDNNTALIKKINQQYQDKYQKPATDMVYRGYETITWYARILNKYGNRFQFSRYDNLDSPYTPFSIKEVRNESNFTKYYENKYLFINKYNNGILQVIEP